MKERAVLFNGAMVRAVLAGEKTQTRRAIKPQPLRAQPPDAEGLVLADFSYDADTLFDHKHLRCPYGSPGDRLWVREAWSSHGPGNPTIVTYQATDRDDYLVRYGPPSDPDWRLQQRRPSELVPMGPWKPSIHMPRWACRLVLEVTDVRVQRLQEITEEDAVAEGMRPAPGPLQAGNPYTGFQHSEGMVFASARDAFLDLWRVIYGMPSVVANPWVWAVTFRRVV